MGIWEKCRTRVPNFVGPRYGPNRESSTRDQGIASGRHHIQDQNVKTLMGFIFHDLPILLGGPVESCLPSLGSKQLVMKAIGQLSVVVPLLEH